MTNKSVLGNLSRPSRRKILKLSGAALAMPFVIKAGRSLAQDDKLSGSGEVVAFTYGGSFTEGLRREVFGQFTADTGIEVVDAAADFGEPQARAMSQAGKMEWDVMLTRATLYPGMSADGMFEPVDYSLWDEESLSGVPESSRREDAVVAFSPAMLLAYDKREYPDQAPKTWNDFWDTGAFPGPRGLYAPEAKHNIQFALMADGLAKADIWPLTDDKVEQALAKLDEVKSAVTKWWTAGGEAPQLLVNREYVMTCAFDGRAIAAIQQGAPIGLSWDDAIAYHNWLTILKGGPNTENAQKLVAYMNRAKAAAGWTMGTGYPAPNQNQRQYLPAELSEISSANPEYASNLLIEDSAWLAETRPDGKTNADHLQELWLAWRAQ